MASLLSKAKAARSRRPARGRSSKVSRDELQLALAYCRGEISMGEGAEALAVKPADFYQWVGRRLMAAVYSGLLMENPEKSG